jgi:hypothetical protein
VTGHRFLLQMADLRKGVNAGLDYVQRQFPRARLSLLSSLAEGADRLVAREAVARGIELIVPLPLPVATYTEDFTTGASLVQFTSLLRCAAEVVELPFRSNRTAAYESAARYVLEHCEILIAVWDGQRAQGAGGTGWSVQEARRRGVPLVWIHAGNRKAGTNVPTSLGARQGTMSVEGFV